MLYYMHAVCIFVLTALLENIDLCKKFTTPHTLKCIGIRLNLSVSVCVHMHACMHACVCACVCMFANVQVCVCV